MGIDWEAILGCEDGDMLQDYYDANIPEDDYDDCSEDNGRKGDKNDE